MRSLRLVALQLLPTRALAAVCARYSPQDPGRGVWRPDEDPLHAMDQALPSEVRAAIASRADRATMRDEQERLRTGSWPITCTYALSSTRGAARAVAISGMDQLVATAAEAPVVVVQPHLGPYDLAVSSLARRGVRVATFTTANDEAVASYLASASESGQDRMADAVTWIQVPSVRSGILAERALRRREILFWQPDAPHATVGGADSTGMLLGRAVSVPSFVSRLVVRHNARVFLVTCQLCAGWRPRVRIRFAPLAIPSAFDHQAVLQFLLDTTTDAIVADPGQWTLWRFADRMFLENAPRGSAHEIG